MAINAATQAQIQTLRDELVVTEKLIQQVVQTYPGDGNILAAFATVLDAQITAVKAAVDAVNAAV